MKIGVLAVQGNFREHAAMLRRLGADSVAVRKPEQLQGLDGLVIPGGESTTFIRLMRLYGLDEAVREFTGPVLGTCAGMIVLDRRHLGAVDIEVDRNAYGRQVASFEADLDLAGESEPLRGVFIRAPRVREVGPEVEVLAELDGEPVLLRDGHVTSVSSTSSGRRTMSGHSKWSSIKHKKGAADAKRGKLFSKLARAIIVAAREGGPDPAANLALQNAIEKARSYSMPKDNIERAIARGSGAGIDSEAFEQVVYEGYGPSGVAIIVEALTDNRNRTAADIRHVFTKNEGSLGTTGAVGWLFERRGIVMVDADQADEDSVMLAAAEGGADDVTQDGSSFEVTTSLESLSSVREALEEAGIDVESAETTMVPKTTVELDDEAAARKTLRLIDALEELDDVDEVYANFDIPEQLLEAVAS
jgi:pyridoxal 5'-phosphate synthase glutaminase subunit Pdx2